MLLQHLLHKNGVGYETQLSDLVRRRRHHLFHNISSGASDATIQRFSNLVRLLKDERKHVHCKIRWKTPQLFGLKPHRDATAAQQVLTLRHLGGPPNPRTVRFKSNTPPEPKTTGEILSAFTNPILHNSRPPPHFHRRFFQFSAETTRTRRRSNFQTVTSRLCRAATAKHVNLRCGEMNY